MSGDDELRAVARAHPCHLDGVVQLLRMLIQTERSGDAADEFRYLVMAHAERPQLHYDIVESLLRSGVPGRALVRMFEDAIARTADDIFCLYGLALAHQVQNGQTKAVQYLREAIAYNPDFAAAHHNLAVACLALDDVDGAVESAKEAMRRDMSMAEPQYILASVAHARGQDMRAHLHFRWFVEQVEKQSADYRQYLGKYAQTAAMWAQGLEQPGGQIDSFRQRHRVAHRGERKPKRPFWKFWK